MAQKQRLEIINRIIFLYTEDYYLSKHLDEDTIRILQEPAKLLQDPVTTDPKRSLRNAVKDYDLRSYFIVSSKLSIFRSICESHNSS